MAGIEDAPITGATAPPARGSPSRRRLLTLLGGVPAMGLEGMPTVLGGPSLRATAGEPVVDPMPRLFAEFRALLDRHAAALAACDRIEATLEAERQAGSRAQAERESADAEAQRQREDAQRATDRQVREKAEAESAARVQREAEAALARDSCNQPEMRRRLMEAANGMDRARYGRRRLVDLMRGSSIGVQGAQGVSCMFLGQWSSGEQGLVTITVRKNSLGDDLIEVRP